MAQTVTDFLQLLGDKATNLYANLSQDQLNTVLANAYDSNDTATINAIKQANPQGYNAFVDSGAIESNDPTVAARNANLKASADAAATSAAAANEANMDYYSTAAENKDYNDIYKSATDSNVGWSDYVSSLSDVERNQLQTGMENAANRQEIEGYAGKDTDGNLANTAYQAAWEKAMNDNNYTLKDSDAALLDSSYSTQAMLWTNLAQAINDNDYDAVQDTLSTAKALGIDISGMNAQNVGQYLSDFTENQNNRAATGVGKGWDESLVNGTTATSDEASAIKDILGEDWFGDINQFNVGATEMNPATGKVTVVDKAEENFNSNLKKLIAAGREDLAAAYVRTRASLAEDAGIDPNSILTAYNAENINDSLGGVLTTEDSNNSSGLASLVNNDFISNLSDKLNGVFYDQSTDSYTANPTYATSESVDSLFTGVPASTTTSTGDLGGSTNSHTVKKSTLSGGGTEGGDSDSDSEGSIFSNADEVNKILTEGTRAAQQTYGEQTATALQPLTEAKDAYNYTDQLDNYNQDWENYKEQTASNNAYLDTQKDAAQNWETYMNPLTEYLNKQIAANYRDTAGSQGSSGSVLEAKNKAIADNTASQYQNAVNTAITNSQNNQNIANSQQNNSNSYLSGSQQTLTNNVTPTTDWTAYMTDYADTNLNANNNLVNAQAQIASQEPTTWDNISDVVSAGVGILTPILSALKS